MLRDAGFDRIRMAGNETSVFKFHTWDAHRVIYTPAHGLLFAANWMEAMKIDDMDVLTFHDLESPFFGMILSGQYFNPATGRFELLKPDMTACPAGVPPEYFLRDRCLVLPSGHAMKQLSRHCGLGVLEDTVETPAPKRVLFDLLASPVGEGLLVSCVNRGAEERRLTLDVSEHFASGRAELGGIRWPASTACRSRPSPSAEPPRWRNGPRHRHAAALFNHPDRDKGWCQMMKITGFLLVLLLAAPGFAAFERRWNAAEIAGWPGAVPEALRRDGNALRARKPVLLETKVHFGRGQYRLLRLTVRTAESAPVAPFTVIALFQGGREAGNHYWNSVVRAGITPGSDCYDSFLTVPADASELGIKLRLGDRGGTAGITDVTLGRSDAGTADRV